MDYNLFKHKCTFTSFTENYCRFLRVPCYNECDKVKQRRALEILSLETADWQSLVQKRIQTHSSSKPDGPQREPESPVCIQTGVLVDKPVGCLFSSAGRRIPEIPPRTSSVQVQVQVQVQGGEDPLGCPLDREITSQGYRCKVIARGQHFGWVNAGLLLPSFSHTHIPVC